MAAPLYVDYQLSFRYPAYHAGIEAEWIAKTKQEKEAWRVAYIRVLGRQDEVQEQEREVVNLRANFDEHYDTGVLDIRNRADFDRYIGYLRVLQGEYQDLARRFEALRAAWLQLRAVEFGQNGIAESLQNALDEAGAAGNQAAQVANAERQLRAWEGDPPVVEDARGRRRMPARWLGEDRARARFRHKLAEDVAAEELGIDPMILGDEGDDGDDPHDDGGEGGEERAAEDKLGSDEDYWDKLDDDSFGSKDDEHRGSVDGGRTETIKPKKPSGEDGLPNERWVPQYKCGGGCSTGYVWLKIDQNGAIRDRLFRKDTFMDTAGWIDPRQWEGDVRDPNNKTPLEMVITNSMSKLRTLRHSVKLRVDPDRSHLDHELFSYRMYLAYAPFGDLATLMNNHNDPANPIKIPEPFVWYVAESLVRAGIAMRNGNKGKEESNKSVWKEIVHKDLKPSNVFLDLPLNDLYPKYATPVLGDYGLAVKTYEDDPMNPVFYRGAGTRGFYPPEQKEQVDRNDLTAIDDFRLSEKTNVFGVGLILWCLVMNRHEPGEPVWLVDPNDDETLAIEDPDEVWSDELKAVIRMCLNYHPDDRPTFQEMLEVIELLTGPAYALDMGMQDGSAPPVVQIASVPRFGDERFAKWAIRPEPRL